MSRQRLEQSPPATRCRAIRSDRLPAHRAQRFFLAVLAFAWLVMALGARRAAASLPCEGDCHDDGQVTIDELITGVGIALGAAAVGDCAPLDLNGNGAVSIDELIRAVNRALGTCFDATVALPGLPGPTDVIYDSLGIPHIYGPDLNSVVYIQGYVHAAHRFWQMDLNRRWAQGRLSELFGFITLQSDVTNRTLSTTRDGRRWEEVTWERIQQTDPEIAAVREAFAAGVNAWLADLRAGRNGATLPPEYGFVLINQGPDDLAPWRPQDSIDGGWGRHEQFILSDTLVFQELSETLNEAAFKDAIRPAPFFAVPVVSGAQPMRSAPLASSAFVPPARPRPGVAGAVRALLDEVARTSPTGALGPGGGSNNWVVAPALSDSGLSMFAFDPHVSMANPPAFFLLQLDVASGPSMRVMGAASLGSPGIFAGHSESGAWGGTDTSFDDVDVYVETISTPPDYPASPRTVLFNGQQVPVLRIEENFLLNGGQVVTYPIEVVPHHGPMLPDPYLSDAEVGLAATGMTMRWPGQEADATPHPRALLNLMRAQNAGDFRAALRSAPRAAEPLNFVWADVHGDIAYFPYALLPQRPTGTVPYAPMPGTGEAEWLTDDQGNIAWLPEEQFPQALNPSDGFIATANSDPTGDTFDNDPLNDGAYFAAWYDKGIREQRVQDMLSNRAKLRPDGAKITMADMSAYQYDTASLEAVRLLPFLFTAAAARPELVTGKMSDAIARLRAWMEEKPGSPACDAVSGIDAHESRADVPPRAQPVSDEERADAAASSIYHAWMKQVWSVPTLATAPWILVPHLLKDIDQTDPAFQVWTKGPNGDSTLWDDPATEEVETRTEVLLAALSRALDLLEQKFSSADMSTWLWGKIHQVRFKHAIGFGYDLGPFAAPGGSWTVNIGYPGGYGGGDVSDFTFSDSGPAQRIVVLLDPAGIRSTDILPGGQNGNPGSAEAFNTINPAIHYGDMIPKWINGETLEMRVSRQDVRADSQRHIRYVPAAQ